MGGPLHQSEMEAAGGKVRSFNISIFALQNKSFDNEEIRWKVLGAGKITNQAGDGAATVLSYSS